MVQNRWTSSLAQLFPNFFVKINIKKNCSRTDLSDYSSKVKFARLVGSFSSFNFHLLSFLYIRVPPKCHGEEKKAEKR